MARLLLYFFTIKHLRWQQIWYRIPLLKRIGRPKSREKLDPDKAGKIENWTSSIAAYPICTNQTFTFLNQSHTFHQKMDWDFLDHGLLWAYNLNYFEFLIQKDLPFEKGAQLIEEYIDRYETLKIGHDPYPISLRLIFWIRFFLKFQVQPKEKQLFALHHQAKELQGKLEYHLLGNHLLENGFALFLAGLFLQDAHIFNSGKKLLKTQLKEQILADGAHFELSPMYHQLMLYRLLDCINLYRAAEWKIEEKFKVFLEETSRRMLGWLKEMTFRDGSFPLLNDAANGIAPTPGSLLAYGERLGLFPSEIILKESGYRKWTGERWEMFMDFGIPGPTYQPGHAHCDLLNFVLQVEDKPVIVDTGTSVYGGNPILRFEERSTKAHNTVQIEGTEQSEIWSDFRMGRRAKILRYREEKDCFVGRISDFNKNEHQREFIRNQKGVTIRDTIETGKKGVAFFHFHPDIVLKRLNSKHVFHFPLGEIILENALEVEKIDYTYAPFFGIRKKAPLLKVSFTDYLETSVHFLK